MSSCLALLKLQPRPPCPPQFLFERGAPVYVKILSAEPDATGSFKVNGSMRVVDQGSGADLDPTGQLAAGGGRSEGLLQMPVCLDSLEQPHKGAPPNIPVE